jgi:hypothetical protein
MKLEALTGWNTRYSWAFETFGMVKHPFIKTNGIQDYLNGNANGLNLIIHKRSIQTSLLVRIDHKEQERRGEKNDSNEKKDTE